MVDFYAATLGLKRLTKPGGTDDSRGAWFDAGNVQLHLGVQPDGFVPAKKAHVGFVVDDLAALAGALGSKGLPLKAGSDLPGFTRIFSEDPAGNRLEFLQRAP
ncbi:MAG: VOC family protein [Planctomycetes bacterium]|nr:VOC family protein [Planctomycetota bacterium]